MRRTLTCLFSGLVVFGGALRLATPASAQGPGCTMNQINTIMAVSEAYCGGDYWATDISCTANEISWTVYCL